jgi:MYXO-CTERM domain-containing protein
MRRSWVPALLVVSTACAGGDAVSLAEQPLVTGDKLVIRQVYGGGGNSGARYKYDFIELFNAGKTTLSLKDLSLQYAPANGMGAFGSTKAFITELPDVQLEPGQSVLVQEAAGEGGTDDLPAPYLTDDSPIALGAKSGRLALVSGTATLSCRTTACPAAEPACTPVPCNQDPRVIDLVGVGPGAGVSEGSPTAIAANTTGASRLMGGCQDTNDNAADFEIVVPVPRTLQSPLTPCFPPDAPADAGEGDAGHAADASVAVDAGAVPDASAGPHDAGASVLDAGSAHDSGAPVVDAGLGAADAGHTVSPDASVVAVDAGVDNPVDASVAPAQDSGAPSRADAAVPAGHDAGSAGDGDTGDGDVGGDGDIAPGDGDLGGDGDVGGGDGDAPVDTVTDPATADSGESSDCTVSPARASSSAAGLWAFALGLVLVRRRRAR